MLQLNPCYVSFLGMNEDTQHAEAQAILDSKGRPYEPLDWRHDWNNYLAECPGTSQVKFHPEIGCLDKFLESSDDEERVPRNTSTTATSDDDDDDDGEKWPESLFVGGRYFSRAIRIPDSDSDLDGEPCSDLDGEPCS